MQFLRSPDKADKEKRLKLRTELEEPELSRLFVLAGASHQNFYEDWLPPEAVVDYAEAVKELVTKLRMAL